MMDLSRQQKQEALDQLIKKLRDGEIPMEQDSLPMEAAPMDEMTPEKAAELSRQPASVPDRGINSDMVAVPLEDYMPAGSYMAGKGLPGQEASPDVTGMEQAPEKEDKFSKLRQLIRNR